MDNIMDIAWILQLENFQRSKLSIQFLLAFSDRISQKHQNLNFD